MGNGIAVRGTRGNSCTAGPDRTAELPPTRQTKCRARGALTSPCVGSRSTDKMPQMPWNFPPRFCVSFFEAERYASCEAEDVWSRTPPLVRSCIRGDGPDWEQLCAATRAAGFERVLPVHRQPGRSRGPQPGDRDPVGRHMLASLLEGPWYGTGARGSAWSSP